MSFRRLALRLVVPLLAAACGSVPPTRYYVLAPARPAAAVAAVEPNGLRIGVEPFTVDPPYDRDQLVYRLSTDSVEVGFYAYHRWAAPLGELVAVAMAEGLRGTAGVAVIEPLTSGGDYSAFLRGRVVYLEEIDLPDRQQARVRCELRLVSAAGEMLWSQEVSGAAEGTSDTVAEVVEQLYSAFGQALEQARSGLVGALSRLDPAPPGD